MIVPTTILSLAALSAAESNSSGKRGLRKSSTPWTAIAVVSGTAVVGLGAGVGLGYLWGSSGAAAGAGAGAGDDRTTCPPGTKGCTAYVAPTGCDADNLVIAKDTCSECPDGKPKGSSFPAGEKNFSAHDGTTTKKFQNPTTTNFCAADGCRKNWHQKTTLNVCVECPAGQYKDAKNTEASALETACTGCKPNFYEVTAGKCAACPTTITKRANNKPFASTPAFEPAAGSTAAEVKTHAESFGCVAA